VEKRKEKLVKNIKKEERRIAFGATV